MVVFHNHAQEAFVVNGRQLMRDLHRHHVGAEFGDLEGTTEALRLAILCAAVELDLPSGLDADDLGKGFALQTPLGDAPDSSSHPGRETLLEFLKALDVA